MREAKNMELVKVQTYESTVLKAVHTKPNLVCASHYNQYFFLLRQFLRSSDLECGRSKCEVRNRQRKLGMASDTSGRHVSDVLVSMK